MSIVTKRGDQGKTKLFSGEIVSKAYPLLNVIGTIDELIACLGLARSLSTHKELTGEIRSLQVDLMKLASGFSKKAGTMEDHVSKIEKKISELEGEIELPGSFLIPGTTPCSSALEISRAVCRRLEREAVAAREAKMFEGGADHIYINRLSDYLFLLARQAEMIAGVPFDEAQTKERPE